jgi:hypothetical protein
MPPLREQHQKFLELYKADIEANNVKPMRIYASILGISKSAAQYWKQMADISDKTSFTKRKSIAMLNALEAVKAKTMAVPVAAKHFGVREVTLYTHCRTHGIDYLRRRKPSQAVAKTRTSDTSIFVAGSWWKV